MHGSIRGHWGLQKHARILGRYSSGRLLHPGVERIADRYQPHAGALGAAVVIVTWRRQFASNVWRAMGVEAFSSEADTGSR
jgi:hypothetical protein